MEEEIMSGRGTEDSAAGPEAELADELRRVLGLPPDAAGAVVSAALRGLAEKASGSDALHAELAALKQSAGEKSRETLIERGCREGKLSAGQLEWARSLEPAALSAYLDHAPRVVPVERLVPGAAYPESGAAALTSEDRAAMRRWKFTENEYRNMKEKN